jgi:hypothetical protein
VCASDVLLDFENDDIVHVLQPVSLHDRFVALMTSKRVKHIE